LIDALPQVGGQLSEIYPHKPIYDIPGYPTIQAQQLVENLMKQIEPFHPTFTLGERVETIEQQEDKTFIVGSSDGTLVHCKAITIAAGLGSFEPRKPEVKNLEKFERGKGVTYFVRNPEDFQGKEIVIAGGGDSALDWTIHLAKVCKKLSLIHRRADFRGAPDSAEKVFDLAKNGKIDLILNANLNKIDGDDRLRKVFYEDNDKNMHTIDADYLIPLFGLSPKLGPIADWGLGIDKAQIKVNTEDFATNIPGIFAIGDINTYPGKLKLILCGFHEAALMAQGAFKFAFPNTHLSFKYTTVNGVQEF